jgi:hypothetical protein
MIVIPCHSRRIMRVKLRGLSPHPTPLLPPSRKAAARQAEERELGLFLLLFKEKVRMRLSRGSMDPDFHREDKSGHHLSQNTIA